MKQKRNKQICMIMNENAVIYDLKYVEEHLSCLNYRLDITTGFMYDEVKAGAVLEAPNVSKNYIVFFLEGKYKISYGMFRDKRFHENQMVCIPRGVDVHAEALTQGHIILMGFDTPESSCDKQIFTTYLSLCNDSMYQMEPTPIKHPLDDFLLLLEYYLRNRMNCIHLHTLKHKEFFLILRGYYPKEAIAYLLHPAICKLSDFRYFVKTNFEKADTVDDLIKLSSYSRPVFYRKFKEEFGDISPQTWMVRQRKPQIVETASIPGMTAKEMMHQLNINSMSTLERLCADLFGCTPTQLIKQGKQRINMQM